MAAPEVPDWTRVVLLSGIDPSGDPITIAVDASGYIVAVMKGEYAGTLKNVAVDDQGRMIMIPTDPADVWGNAISMGNAELAVRLGYPGGYDDRGRVLFADSFEHGKSGGFSSISGFQAEVSISSDTARFGGYSLLLRAGSDSGQFAMYEYFLPYPVLGRVGTQASFTVASNTSTLDLSLSLYDATTFHRAIVRYDHVNAKVQYYDGAGIYQDLITDIDLYEDNKDYHYLKVVIDLANDHYHRVSLDNWKWTTGGLDIYTTPSTLSKRYRAWVKHTSVPDAAADSYMDGIIFTQNEPA